MSLLKTIAFALASAATASIVCCAPVHRAGQSSGEHGQKSSQDTTRATGTGGDTTTPVGLDLPGWIVETTENVEYVSDCNNNGISDDVDARTGVIEDVNGNGLEDMCDYEPSVYSFVRTGWTRLADRSDSSYVGIAYRPGEYLIIKYTVPQGKHRVVIRAANRKGGRETILKDAIEPQGSYQLQWIPKTESERPVLAGEFDLHAIIASREYRKILAWRWEEPKVSGDRTR